MQIRPANAQDAPAISALIQSVAHYFTVNSDGSGAEEFFNTITPQAIAYCVQDCRFLYLAGFIDVELAGVIAIRDKSHLYHLFVAPRFQRLGYARSLWEAAKEQAMQQGGDGGFTVNSSPYAMPTYASFGFEPTGPQVQTKGIAFVPMKLAH